MHIGFRKSPHFKCTIFGINLSNILLGVHNLSIRTLTSVQAADTGLYTKLVTARAAVLHQYYRAQRPQARCSIAAKCSGENSRAKGIYPLDGATQWTRGLRAWACMLCVLPLQRDVHMSVCDLLGCISCCIAAADVVIGCWVLNTAVLSCMAIGNASAV